MGLWKRKEFVIISLFGHISIIESHAFQAINMTLGLVYLYSIYIG